MCSNRCMLEGRPGHGENLTEITALYQLKCTLTTSLPTSYPTQVWSNCPDYQMITGILPATKKVEHPSETECIYKITNICRIWFHPISTNTYQTIRIAQPGSLEVAASVYEEWRNEVPWAEAALRCLKACFNSFTWPVAWKFVSYIQYDNFSGRDELRLEFSVCQCFCSCFLVVRS